MLDATIRYLRNHHLGLIALVVALGGTAYAANEIGSREVRDDSLRSKDIKDDKVKGRDLQHDSVKGVHVDEATLDNDVSSTAVLAEGTEISLVDADGFTAVKKTGTGTYVLTLDASAPGCNFATTLLGAPGGSTVAGGGVTLTELGGTEVTAVVHDNAGDPTDLDDGEVFGFQIIGTC